MRSPSAADRRARRRVARALLLAVTVTAGLAVTGSGGSVASAGVAADTDAAAGLGLAVEIGYAGRTGGAAWVPVTVTLQPDRLVAGTLSVETRTDVGGVREERDVEVAVGSRSAFRFVVPRGTVVASLDPDGGQVVNVRPPPSRDGGDFLAGVLGSVPQGAPPLRSEALARSGTWVGIDPEWAELSAGALAPLSGLVADERALADLSPGGLRNVAVAVAAGMDLVVVGSLPDGLPWSIGDGAWVLAASEITDDAGAGSVAATVVPAGRGRVATTSDAPGSGIGRSPALWSALIEPRPALVDEGGGPLRAPVGALLGTGTSTVPTLPWLAAFLVAYIVVVGPVNGFVLARFGRRELAWVTVPAVTVVFTAAGWLGATGSQPPVGFTGSATAWVDGSASEFVVAVSRSPTAGQRRLVLPSGAWEVRAEGVWEPAVVRRADTLTVDLVLPALQAGGLVARRPVDELPPLGLEATGTSEGLEVTVTNVAAQTVAGVTVRAATATARVGDLTPGESQTVTVDGEHLPVDDWAGQGPGMPGAGVAGPGALEPVLAGVLDGQPGLVWATGTLASGETGVRIDGAAPADVGRFVAVASRAGGLPRPHTVDRELVDAGPDAYRYAPLIVEGSGPMVLRYRIGAAGLGAPLRSTLDRDEAVPPGQQRRELWLWERTERQWRPLDDALPGGVGDPAGYVSPLGEVYVRVTGSQFPLQFSGMALSVGAGS